MRKLPLLTLLLLAPRAVAQTPADDWRTVETPHFRVHYPRDYEAWSLRAASKLESIRSAVAGQTGYAAETRADVIVVNPIARANGLTYPLLDTPRIVLFAQASEPDEQIGEFGEWIDLLTTHEMTHLVHLVRPSRNPTRRALEHLIPFGPILLSAPRWVNEGYATVIEGRLTGSGRPSSSFRAAVLRKWAESGQLPTYAQLDSDHRFLGMSMAYLAGSAFLEWLEARGGPASLRNLWSRMTARQSRNFTQAFEGVFGDTPQRLYGQFTAELVERSVTVDRDARLAEGELWQETKRSSGDPAVSPDGKQIALVIRDEHHSKLVILSTAAESEEEKKYNERIEKMLARDPQDVAPVRTKPLPRKPVHSLTLPQGGDIESPRWTRDGKSILFTHRTPDTHGDLHRDIFRWTPDDGVQRITHLADVYDADPFPDGRTAVAVRARFGMTQLVTIDLATGEVKPLTEPSIERVISHPRVNPRDGRIAYVAHTNGAWQLVVSGCQVAGLPGCQGAASPDFTSGIGQLGNPATNIATPEWSGDDIFATVLSNGSIDIFRFPAAEPVTRMSGGAFQPAPSPDGRLFFMALDPDGFNLRVLKRIEAVPPRAVAPQHKTMPPPFAAQALPPPRQYGLGRQELTWILSGNDAPSAHTTEIGVRAGDVIGRLDTIAVASIGSDRSPRGATIAALWQGWPIALRGQAYSAREPIGKQHGLELRGLWTGIYPMHILDVSAGSLWGAGAPAGGFFTASLRAHQRQLREHVAIAAESKHARAFGRIETKLGNIRFGAEAQRDQSRRNANVLLGGIAPTILPESAVANRILDPALETATLAGTRYTGTRVDLSLSGLTLFYRQHRMNERLNEEGVEIATRMPAMPLLKTPALDLTAGAARVLQRTRWWIGVRLSP
jgi:hypothetical protein